LGLRRYLVFLCWSPIFGQVVTAGFTAGVPVTETFESGYSFCESGLTARTVRYTIGPALDFRVFGPLRGEIDALYQPFSFQTQIVDCAPAPTYIHTHGSLWQFPVLLKLRIPAPVVKPFIEAGISVQLAAGVTESQYNLVQRTPVTYHLEPNAVPGFVAGGGVEFHFRSLIFAPEIRYTRWFDQNFAPLGEPPPGSNLNQLQILLSIRVPPQHL